jgi:hypothetical protein
MAQITPERFLIQQPSTAPQAAVSEDTMSKIGASINHAVTNIVMIQRCVIQGPYNLFAPPNETIDGIFSYPFNFSIIDLILSSGPFNGTSGTLELDIKWRPQNTGSWTSIFSTTPKFDASLVGDKTSIALGQTVTGMTAPVLSKTDFDAYDQLRFDILQVPSGYANSATLESFWRAR